MDEVREVIREALRKLDADGQLSREEQEQLRLKEEADRIAEKIRGGDL